MQHDSSGQAGTTIEITDAMIEAGEVWLQQHYSWSERLFADASPSDIVGLLSATLRGGKITVETGEIDRQFYA